MEVASNRLAVVLAMDNHLTVYFPICPSWLDSYSEGVDAP